MPAADADARTTRRASTAASTSGTTAPAAPRGCSSTTRRRPTSLVEARGHPVALGRPDQPDRAPVAAVELDPRPAGRLGGRRRRAGRPRRLAAQHRQAARGPPVAAREAQDLLRVRDVGDLRRGPDERGLPDGHRRGGRLSGRADRDEPDRLGRGRRPGASSCRKPGQEHKAEPIDVIFMLYPWEWFWNEEGGKAFFRNMADPHEARHGVDRAAVQGRAAGQQGAAAGAVEALRRRPGARQVPAAGVLRRVRRGRRR